MRQQGSILLASLLVNLCIPKSGKGSHSSVGVGPPSLKLCPTGAARCSKWRSRDSASRHNKAYVMRLSLRKVRPHPVCESQQLLSGG